MTIKLPGWGSICYGHRKQSNMADLKYNYFPFSFISTYHVASYVIIEVKFIEPPAAAISGGVASLNHSLYIPDNFSF